MSKKIDFKKETIQFNYENREFLQIDVTLFKNKMVDDIEFITDLVTVTLSKYFDLAFGDKKDFH